MKSRNENTPKMDKIEDVLEPTQNRNPMTSQTGQGSKDIYGVPAVGGATQHGLNREISNELERRLDVKAGPNVDVFKSKPDSALPTQGKPVPTPSPPVREKPVPAPPRKPVAAPAPPKKVPSVPEPTYTLDGVRFNEKAEVVEVAPNKRKDSSSSGTSESSGSSTSSSDGSDESSSSDEEITSI